MPPKKQEDLKTAREPCILKIGRFKNVVQWKEEMQNEACSLYGMTGMFFSTNESHFIPYPREEDYNPFVAPDADDEDTDDDASVEEAPVGPALPDTPPPVVVPTAFVEKLRANAYEGRRKLVEAL